MKVRILSCMAGNSVVWNVGDVAEFSDAEALRLCDHGHAEPLGPETASVAPAENASKPKGKPRGSKAGNTAGN